MIREYKAKDRKELVNLLRLNTPKYFDQSEEDDFVEYLDNSVEDYYVIEKDLKLVGGGGINYFLDEGVARISWDIINPSFHGNGLGKKLILYRIERISQNVNIKRIIVRTSQHAFNFYQKMGFEVTDIIADYWAAGMDLYEMQLSNNEI